jgi:membrane protein implicated in regulation of membrane protease activity
MSGALKLAAGFGGAAAVIAFVLVLLAVYPNVWLLAALVAPPVVVGAIALDSARRRRTATRRRARTRLARGGE